MKRVTKAAIRRMAEKFQEADALAEEIRAKEAAERADIAPELDKTLDW